MRDKNDLRSLRWLYKELPSLVESKVITPETASHIQLHYGELPVSQNIKWLQIIFSIFGTALIAGGVSLIVAHNWDDFPRFVRVIFSFLPLVASQLISIFVLWKKNHSTIWIESSSLFHGLMVGTCIALISQTYHIQGNMDSYLFTWLLLALPLIYVHRSALSAMLGIVLVVFWALNSISWLGCSKQENHWLWLKFLCLYAVILPRIIVEWRRNLLSWQSILLGWCFSLGLILSYTSILPISKSNFASSFTYGATLIVLYAVDKFFFRTAANPFSRPLYLVGSLGILIYIFATSFKQTSSFYPLHFFDLQYWIPLFITLLSFFLFIACYLKKYPLNYVFSLFPLILLLTQCIGNSHPSITTVIMNVYGLILSLACILSGLDSRRWSVTNAGVFLGAALILARFFSDDFSFIIRGLAFIALGIVFLSVNYLLWRKSRKESV